MSVCAGIPQAPEEPIVRDLGGGNVEVTVRTLASGTIPGKNLSFTLLIRRMTIGTQPPVTSSSERRMDVLNYMSGDVVTFSLTGLVQGDFYSFEAVVRNAFGTSGRTTSKSLFLTTGSHLLHKKLINL